MVRKTNKYSTVFGLHCNKNLFYVSHDTIYDPFERLHHLPPEGLNQHASKVATKVFLEVFFG